MNDKLKRGDYFEGGTNKQYKDILEIESLLADTQDYIDSCDLTNGITLLGEELVFVERNTHLKKIPHTFEEFKQKCINTFAKQ